MTQQPWASGPSEILQHGLSLLEKDSDKNRRLAMISIDNAVELTIKTFLGLPKRITGINISRKEYQEISESFPMLLDALEKHASSKLDGIDLGEIEWFHRLRNQLYHQGNGLTIEKDKVAVYAELAILLFKNLFGFNIEADDDAKIEMLGSFLSSWAEIDKTITKLVNKNKDQLHKLPSPAWLGKTGLPAWIIQNPVYGKTILTQLDVIDDNIANTIESLRAIRNSVIHGQKDFKDILSKETIKKTKQLETELKNLL